MKKKKRIYSFKEFEAGEIVIARHEFCDGWDEQCWIRDLPARIIKLMPVSSRSSWSLPKQVEGALVEFLSDKRLEIVELRFVTKPDPRTPVIELIARIDEGPS